MSLIKAEEVVKIYQSGEVEIKAVRGVTFDIEHTMHKMTRLKVNDIKELFEMNWRPRQESNLRQMD